MNAPTWITAPNWLPEWEDVYCHAFGAAGDWDQRHWSTILPGDDNQTAWWVECTRGLEPPPRDHDAFETVECEAFAQRGRPRLTGEPSYRLGVRGVAHALTNSEEFFAEDDNTEERPDLTDPLVQNWVVDRLAACLRRAARY